MPMQHGDFWTLDIPPHKGSPGQRCRIAPALGFNCFSWEVFTPDGLLEVLWRTADFEVNPHPMRSGIPILFPFPNRIRDGRFTWDGKQYQLPINDPQNRNAIHGLVCHRPWKVTAWSEPPKPTWRDRLFPSQRMQPDCWVEAVFDSRDHPEITDLWPGHYLCTGRYRLSTFLFGLSLDFTVKNVGDSILPFGLGFHPYFRMNPERAQIALRLVKSGVEVDAWELIDLLPTGTFRPLNDLEDELIGNVPSGSRSAIGAHHLDGVYHTRAPKNECIYSWLGNETDGMVIVSTDDRFQTHVLFTPPHRQAVCVEPYTCPTDAINLHQRGIECGLLFLQPRETWKTQVLWSYHPGRKK
jgi:aldose 1-epimerase